MFFLLERVVNGEGKATKNPPFPAKFSKTALLRVMKAMGCLAKGKYTFQINSGNATHIQEQNVSSPRSDLILAV